MELQKNWLSKRILHQKEILEDVYEASFNICVSTDQQEITLSDEKKYVGFASVSYLGLANDSRIVSHVGNTILSSKQGISFASARTRVIFQEEVLLLEKLHSIFAHYHPLLFQNVHVTHLGILPLLGSGHFPSVIFNTNGCSFLVDRYSHQSIKCILGILAQFGNVDICDVLDIDTLERKMENCCKYNKTPIIVTDSLGSMGRIIPVTEVVALVHKYKGYVYFDDAHGTSVFGKNGAGYVIDKLNYIPNNRVFISTALTKGFGACGGMMLFPKVEQVEFSKKYATTYTFSSQLSFANLLAIDACANIHLTDEVDTRQKILKYNLSLFDNIFSFKDYNQLKDSILPFRIIFIGDERKALNCYRYLKENGILATCAVYPTVDVDKAIIRLSFTATHTSTQINLLANKLETFLDSHHD